jgi:hypothetical protein
MHDKALEMLAQPYLQDFPPPAQQSELIALEVKRLLQTSPTFEQDLAQLHERAWSVYVDSRQDNRQIHIHNETHYHVENSFNDNRHDYDNTTSTTSTITEINWKAGIALALVVFFAIELLRTRAYVSGYSNGQQRQLIEVMP